jgi:hypothetical protein
MHPRNPIRLAHKERMHNVRCLAARDPRPSIWSLIWLPHINLGRARREYARARRAMAKAPSLATIRDVAFWCDAYRLQLALVGHAPEILSTSWVARAYAGAAARAE